MAFFKRESGSPGGGFLKPWWDVLYSYLLTAVLLLSFSLLLLNLSLTPSLGWAPSGAVYLKPRPTSTVVTSRSPVTETTKSSNTTRWDTFDFGGYLAYFQMGTKKELTPQTTGAELGLSNTRIFNYPVPRVSNPYYPVPVPGIRFLFLVSDMKLFGHIS